MALSSETVLSSAEIPAKLDLSICIVNWNCRDYLRALLSSIDAEQKHVALETIVLDNGSTDDSVSMVEAEFPQVCLIRKRHHQGIAKGNNEAAQRARGDLLLFLNNDTVVTSGCLARMVAFLEQHPDVSEVVPSHVGPDGKSQETVRKRLHFRALLHRILFLRWTRIFRSADREYRQVNFDLKHSSYVEQLVGAALMVRKSQFMSIGGYDETFEYGLDDVDLSLRLARIGRMYYLAEAQVIHWGGIATKLDEAFAYRCQERSYAYYLEKHCGRWRGRCYKVLVTLDMPVRIGILILRWLWQKLQGNSAKATRNLLRLTAAAQFFFFRLPQYWRS